MFEYWNIDKFISKKADLYNYMNPFFDLKYLESHNFFYLNYALRYYKNYLDNIYLNVDSKIKLDINQRIALLSNPKSELILAGAGSGKTTTIAAKIKYMVEILKINPDEILLLSYTNEAIHEMQKIIVDKFKIAVKIMTFHKFAIFLLNCHEKIHEKVDCFSIIKKLNFKEKILMDLVLYFNYNLTVLALIRKDNKLRQAFFKLEGDMNKYYYEKNILKSNFKAFLFKKLVPVYFKYASNIVTFDTLIYKVASLEQYSYQFNYLLIDEYQDISNLRLSFLKKYLQVFNSSIMAVGDDFQTIYSFAASNINNILNFDKEFKDAKQFKILKTYRNSQELIDVVGNFIMKNPAQIKKRLVSPKRLDKPIEFINYKSASDLRNKIAAIIEEYSSKELAFLGRYKFDLSILIDDHDFKKENNQIIYKDLKKIPFYTIHTSKGLGFDYVFLLNLKKGYYGFPPSRKNRTIFKEENPLAEERRLFYVALTRTKNKVYLVYQKNNMSTFIKEIKKMLKKK